MAQTTNNSYSGLFDRFYGTPYAGVSTFNTSENNNSERLDIARQLRSKGGRALARLLITLAGAAPGATASETLSQLTSAAGVSGGANDPLSQGGKRVVAPVTLINRATTSGDATMLQGIATQAFGPVVNTGYPVDKSGNGGGAKLSVGAAGSGNYGF